jgi:MraZ protein
VTDVELDSAGRILIPKSMALYANLEKEVILVGMGNRLELWDPKSYMQYVISDDDEFSELVQKHLTEG